MAKYLTPREEEVISMVAQGLKDIEIAERLFVSRRRIAEIIFNVKNKWNVSSRVELGILAYHFGIVYVALQDQINFEIKKEQKRYGKTNLSHIDF